MAWEGKLGGDARRSRVVHIGASESAQVVAEISGTETDCGDQEDDQEQLPMHAITSD
jgi:hypothetical protein